MKDKQSLLPQKVNRIEIVKFHKCRFNEKQNNNNNDNNL